MKVIGITSIPKGMTSEDILRNYKQRGVLIFDSNSGNVPSCVEMIREIPWPSTGLSLNYFYWMGECFKTHSGLLFRLMETGEYQGKAYEVYEEVKNFEWK